MTYQHSVLGPLADQFSPGNIYAAWLQGQPMVGTGSASDELQAALAVASPVAKSPLWQNERFAALLPTEFRELAAGPAVVVTGQQPGFLGGPLLILYKIATGIALAQQRTAAGLPTVPVFWSGDDDDDLAEALAPVGWDPAQGRVFRAEGREQLRSASTQRQILSDIGARQWAQPVPGLRSSNEGGDGLQSDLAKLLAAATADDVSWGAGQVKMIERIFAGSGLVVIRGHDPELHQVAAPFYQQISTRLPELAALVEQRGEALAAAGFHAQINGRSLQRPLFEIQAGRRVAVADAVAVDPKNLRPGVMLRSPVQDWLLRPAAVVVGPGELAYLRQLDPLYSALELTRCALVPRLSGWVLPQSNSRDGWLDLVRPGKAGASDDPKLLASTLADQVVDPARAQIARILAETLGLPEDRAAAMADGRGRRFRKGVTAMFAEEVTRQQKERLAEAPQWVLPDGQRQERSLGMLSAVGLWGEQLMTAIFKAAEQHLAAGQQGSWQESVLTVPEGTVAR